MCQVFDIAGLFISGRAIEDLLPLLGLDPAPEIWGCHGWECMLADGRRLEVVLPDLAADGLTAAFEWVHVQGFEGLCEQKPVSIAIHWRGLSSVEQKRLASKIEAGWQPIADQYGLDIHPFDGGLELRCQGRDKGTAIREVLAHTDKGDVVAFLGDDLTDEDGFKEISGCGMGVLVRSDMRPTRADIQISPPEELLDFLKTWLETAMPASTQEKGVQ